MRRALAIDEASFGPDHPKVATDLNNLAGLLQDTNRLAEAEPLMSPRARHRRGELRAGSSQRGDGLNNLAALLQATNRLGEAEPLMRRALAIDEASYGPDHPKVAIRLNNLARLLQATNRLAEAEPLYRRALAIFEASFGPDHPKVASALSNLALLLQATNRLGEAEPLMRRALAIDEASFGPDHPYTLSAIERGRARSGARAWHGRVSSTGKGFFRPAVWPAMRRGGRFAPHERPSPETAQPIASRAFFRTPYGAGRGGSWSSGFLGGRARGATAARRLSQPKRRGEGRRGTAGLAEFSTVIFLRKTGRTANVRFKPPPPVTPAADAKNLDIDEKGFFRLITP